MAKDIVVLLHGSYRNPKDGVVVVSPRLLTKAADEIERLRTQLDELNDLYKASRQGRNKFSDAT